MSYFSIAHRAVDVSTYWRPGSGKKTQLFSSHNYQALYGSGANWRLLGVSRSPRPGYCYTFLLYYSKSERQKPVFPFSQIGRRLFPYSQKGCGQNPLCKSDFKFFFQGVNHLRSSLRRPGSNSRLELHPFPWVMYGNCRANKINYCSRSSPRYEN